jgi:hypothetical protein
MKSCGLGAEAEPEIAVLPAQTSAQERNGRDTLVEPVPVLDHDISFHPRRLHAPQRDIDNANAGVAEHQESSRDFSNVPGSYKSVVP